MGAGPLVFPAGSGVEYDVQVLDSFAVGKGGAIVDPVAEQILQDMKVYYHERAQEYDEWFYRQGRYRRDPQSDARWFIEVDEVMRALADAHIEGDVLELAPGTGIWTEQLLRSATSVTAVDASLAMLALNRARVASPRVSYLQADLFSWRPERRYDAVFCGFWLSHVPRERLDAFLASLAAMLSAMGKVFFVDGRREPTSTAVDHQLPELESQIMVRKLNDGRAFEIVKNFYDPSDLQARCNRVGLAVEVRETATYFLYGSPT
jgi:demethylmenaquinone methyltransferase/2-methoxy-6-polyprenyl-1,4-benzoquinol methylase